MDIFVIEIVDADNVHMDLLKQFQHKEFEDLKKWNAHCFSYLMVDRILREFYHIEDREIIFDNNKPIMKNNSKKFSISRTDKFIALAFSDNNCSINILDKNILSSDNSNEISYKKAKVKLNDKANSTKQFLFGDYIITALSNSLNEEFEIYAQSGEVIPQ